MKYSLIDSTKLSATTLLLVGRLHSGHRQLSVLKVGKEREPVEGDG